MQTPQGSGQVAKKAIELGRLHPAKLGSRSPGLPSSLQAAVK